MIPNGSALDGVHHPTRNAFDHDHVTNPEKLKCSVLYRVDEWRGSGGTWQGCEGSPVLCPCFRFCLVFFGRRGRARGSDETEVCDVFFFWRGVAPGYKGFSAIWWRCRLNSSVPPRMTRAITRSGLLWDCWTHGPLVGLDFLYCSLVPCINTYRARPACNVHQESPRSQVLETGVWVDRSRSALPSRFYSPLAAARSPSFIAPENEESQFPV